MLPLSPGQLLIRPNPGLSVPNLARKHSPSNCSLRLHENHGILDMQARLSALTRPHHKFLECHCCLCPSFAFSAVAPSTSVMSIMLLFPTRLERLRFLPTGCTPAQFLHEPRLLARQWKKYRIHPVCKFV